HPTTLMCLQALEKCKIKDSMVYDLGCGSGILSAAAAKMGAAKVIAVDFDPTSIKAAEENCRLNQVGSLVEVHRGELPIFIEDNKDLPPGDIILANLTAGLIIKNLPYLSALCKEDTVIIFSGIIQEKLENLLENLWDQGYRVEETITEKGWVTLRTRGI
ncbi:MAG: 50S ribosomal protein L11 methyltransferase, partial [Candidatus Contubernalis sp.]|nr:50S ribosomal protein L11 methyltransferase [Candidatus Contubernalis sp.]